MPHDFIKFPELTNSQMALYYFESPHKQILEDIRVNVIKVHDGDTITVEWNQRDFNFPVRFLDTNSPELNEPGGDESRDWLKARIGGKEIDLIIDKDQRVGKWGRLLAKVMFGGVDINEESIMIGKSTTFENRKEAEIPDFNKEVNKAWQ